MTKWGEGLAEGQVSKGYSYKPCACKFGREQASQCDHGVEITVSI